MIKESVGFIAQFLDLNRYMTFGIAALTFLWFLLHESFSEGRLTQKFNSVVFFYMIAGLRLLVLATIGEFVTDLRQFCKDNTKQRPYKGSRIRSICGKNKKASWCSVIVACSLRLISNISLFWLLLSASSYRWLDVQYDSDRKVVTCPEEFWNMGKDCKCVFFSTGGCNKNSTALKGVLFFSFA